MGRVGSYAQKLWRPTQATPDTQWRGYAFDGMGRLSTVHEAGDLPITSGVLTHTLTAAQVEALATQVSAATWAYTREDEVGSLLSISHVQGGYAPRFTAPARGPGYQLDTYDVAGTGTRTVGHDSAGRMVADGDVAYTWDAFSSLAAVKTNGALTEALQYDGLGRLVGRYAGNGNLLDEYVWDGAQLVSSLTASGSRRWTAYWGAGIDNLVSVSVGGDEYLAVHDGRGSVAALHSAVSNRVVAALDYTPEGRAGWRTFDGKGTETGNCEERDSDATCGGALGVPFGFHTALKSEGTGLLYFRNRWYSTTAGQWLSRDALGPVDSHNLYAFNGFDSVNFVDPWGLNSGAAGPAVQGDEYIPGESYEDYCKRTKSLCDPEPIEVVADVCTGPICEVMGQGPGMGAGMGDGLDSIPINDAWLVGPPPQVPTPLESPPRTIRPPKLPPPGGPKGPGLRPDPVTVGVVVGLLLCSQIPQCAEKLDGIVEEADRLARVIGERMTGGEKPAQPPPNPTPPPAPVPPPVPNPGPAQPEQPEAAPAPALEPVADGAGALQPPGKQGSSNPQKAIAAGGGAKATVPYQRPSGATKPAQRASVQGKPCVDCGAVTPKQVADHKTPLVKEHYETGTIDTTRMRSVDAVQPQCPTCSARQGAELSRYSREQRRLLEV